MSLRTRLLVALLALVAAGLVVAGVVTYVSLRGFLLERVDAQLRDARVPMAMALTNSAGVSGLPGGPGGSPGGANLPPGTYGQLRDSAGNVVNAVSFTYGQTAVPTPVLPDSARHTQRERLPGLLRSRPRRVGRRRASACSWRTCRARAASSSSPSRSTRRARRSGASSPSRSSSRWPYWRRWRRPRGG